MDDVLELDRRQMVKAAAGLPLATMTLAAILADPKLAKAAGDQLQSVEVTTKGGKTVKAALALPATQPAPAVMLIHEWWGLNDQIKAVAAEFARLGYVALAIDMFDGNVATTPDAARAQTKALKADVGQDIAATWLAYLKDHKASNGKLGTIGWCFGGGWSLNASMATPVDATVIYYGRVNKTADQLAGLQSPVLGHFGSQDKFINKPMVDGFEAEMKKAGKAYAVHWYDANHAFANPTSARYDEGDAKLAWDRSMAFFKKHMG